MKPKISTYLDWTEGWIGYQLVREEAGPGRMLEIHLLPWLGVLIEWETDYRWRK